MPSVLTLRKTLVRTPETLDLGRDPSRHDLSLRSYRVGDAAHWLRLQSVALPSSQAGRDWTDRDFAREFLSQSWWSPERMLFAATASGRTVGTATLGGRGGQEVHSEATVHWLLVDPEYQRRGVATTLVAQLEWMCWEAGGRSMTLETLSIWEAAVAFYVARGYVVTS